jgi:hypothetical protein
MSLPGRNTNRGAASNSDLPDKAVREHVAHICQTKGFLKSERLKRFLSYTVERLLANDTDTLKNTQSRWKYSIAAPHIIPKSTQLFAWKRVGCVYGWSNITQQTACTNRSAFIFRTAPIFR